MGDGLKRAFAAAKASRQKPKSEPPVKSGSVFFVCMFPGCEREECTGIHSGEEIVIKSDTLDSE